MPMTVARIEFRWLKRAFLFVVGFAFLDAHAATPSLPTGVVPVAYRIAVAPDLATSRFTGTEEIDVVVKQSTDTVVVNATALAIDTAGLKGDGNSQASVSIDERSLLLAQGMTRCVIHLLVASSGVDGKQLVHQLYDTDRGGIQLVELDRVDKLPP